VLEHQIKVLQVVLEHQVHLLQEVEVVELVLLE